jgi:hypothetical protein
MNRPVLSTDPRGLTAIDPLGRRAHLHPYQVHCGLNVYAHVSLDQDPGTGPTHYSDFITGYQITGGSRADLTALRQAWALQAETLRLLDHPQGARDTARVAALDTLLATSSCPAGVNPDGPCYTDRHAAACTCNASSDA